MPDQNKKTGVGSLFVKTWNSFDNTQKIAIVAGLLALISPFTKWFHSCVTPPGTYACETWNGFEKDNDIYGSLIFVTAAFCLISIVLPVLKREYKIPFNLKLSTVLLVSGIFLILLGIVRLVTFKGKSSELISIGPSTGLLLVFLSGLGMIVAAQHKKIIGFMQARKENLSQRVQQPKQISDEISDYSNFSAEEEEILATGPSELNEMEALNTSPSEVQTEPDENEKGQDGEIQHNEQQSFDLD